ncbi:hypothetical protein ERO13_D12G119500v2 [Gossypium hirsutum]|uniref:Invertase inhibitor n=6 Tax=Gossypium TaxID=3633 RepID=A0A1U8NF69_GOSHI|nr:putative invertase inhibitor [Gossypium hirsutum]KAB1999033.1 hypothetical protein ES319_D12G133000v1 [Gossypium barbadense]MBA0688826.1 hypothetical protein [Gossypium aridum]MBA0717810.1 hypothetical protein [Gossypium laxum]TYG41014.1 hypothetical protein ES288_D12G141500v1 [Gossypium darwinii]TYH38881.1 hypothetical protein ES332_D12G141400v1 [Gossypium tomentosum]
MKNSHISSLVFFYLLLVSVSSNLIQESCNKAAKLDPQTIKLDFCVSNFEGNPKAKSATTVSDLVEVSIEAAITNATSIGSIISKLLENKSLESFERDGLKNCSWLYSLAGTCLQGAGEAFKAKNYATAGVDIVASIEAPMNCEDQFKKKKGFVSPLTKENNIFFLLTDISRVFMTIAQKG